MAGLDIEERLREDLEQVAHRIAELKARVAQFDVERARALRELARYDQLYSALETFDKDDRRYRTAEHDEQSRQRARNIWNTPHWITLQDLFSSAGLEGLNLEQMLTRLKLAGHEIRGQQLRPFVAKAAKDGELERIGSGRYRLPASVIMKRVGETRSRSLMASEGGPQEEGSSSLAEHQGDLDDLSPLKEINDAAA